MRTNISANTQSVTKTKTTIRKTWQWNSSIVEAEQNHAKLVQAAQRRFRNAI